MVPVAEPNTPDSRRWRIGLWRNGRKVRRHVYQVDPASTDREADPPIGILDTEELAALAVTAVNAYLGAAPGPAEDTARVAELRAQADAQELVRTERDELAAAIREVLEMHADHHKLHHPDSLIGQGCDVCRVRVRLSRALLGTPDDPAERARGGDTSG